VLLELAAHDLRNPLSGVLSATQLLIEEASPVLTPDQIVLLRSIESSTQSMLRLVEDMVDLRQFAVGGLKLDRHSVEIGLLVEHVVAVHRPLAEDRGIKLDLGVRKPEARVKADPVKLFRALEVLLSSVIRSSDVGGRIELLVDVDTGHVVITLRHEIAAYPSAAPTLRSLFDTSPPSRTRRKFSEERAAIMLAYARGIVAAHQGTVRLNARHGAYSLAISLPVLGKTKLLAHPKPAGRKMSAGR
jgi:signal transduction histidine kinase